MVELDFTDKYAVFYLEMSDHEDKSGKPSLLQSRISSIN